MKIGKIVAAAVATMSLVGGTSPAAAAACWAPRAVEAAQVRNFETMLMVATLRCQIKGVDLSTDYNRFIREKRTVLIGINDDLRAKFTDQGLRGNAALNAYDRYVTSLANSFGSGEGQMSCLEFKTLMKTVHATQASRIALVELATRSGSDPVRSADRCSPRMALAN